MKAIQNISVFHNEKYHRRYFVLEFGQPYCFFYEKKSDSAFLRAHKQVSLLSAKALEDDEVQKNLDSRERKRSKSFLRNLMQG